MRVFLVWSFLWVAFATAADQSRPGAGNARAIAIADESPLVQSARQFLVAQARRIQDAKLRTATLEVIDNPGVCIAHRARLTKAQKDAVLSELLGQGLMDPADGVRFPNGSFAGVFPPVLDGTDCPKLPQPFYSAPGSSFGGHHGYPGGLMLHEAFNEVSSLNFASGYRRVYGSSRSDGLPVVGGSRGADEAAADVFISDDIAIAAPIWHDWAKSIVFQWNADGTEFQELSFGGDRASKTGAHHILGISEAMKRDLPRDFIVALACAHAAPIGEAEYKVVGWIRAAAVVARVDPVARGYLVRGEQNRLRLRPLRVEDVLHNLSDADFVFSGPAIIEVDGILAKLAGPFGFNAADAQAYNNGFRNRVLSYFSAERLMIMYGNSGLEGVVTEIAKISRLQR